MAFSPWKGGSELLKTVALGREVVFLTSFEVVLPTFVSFRRISYHVRSLFKNWAGNFQLYLFVPYRKLNVRWYRGKHFWVRFGLNHEKYLDQTTKWQLFKTEKLKFVNISRVKIVQSKKKIQIDLGPTMLFMLMEENTPSMTSSRSSTKA